VEALDRPGQRRQLDRDGRGDADADGIAAVARGGECHRGNGERDQQDRYRVCAFFKQARDRDGVPQAGE